MPAGISPRLREQIAATARNIRAARRANKPVMLTYGAHLVKNGLAPVIVRMLEEGWITHLATNGAGSIHDWEFAYLGQSSEDVEKNTARGEFGTWDETGRCINLAVAVGGCDGLGYGASVGKMIFEDGMQILSSSELRSGIAGFMAGTPDERLGSYSDLLCLSSEFGLPSGAMNVNHPFKEYSIQSAAYRLAVPLTVHPGIGYDIIYTHPMNSGGAIGRGAVRDFLTYAESVSRLGQGGVHMSVGSAIMAPMIFEKSLSMANNLAIEQTGEPLANYHLVVVDIQDGGDWNWSDGEPPMDNPAYYLRFCKSFYRMGGDLDYICLDNRAFMLGLYHELNVLPAGGE
ncbi:MAG TPA: hypothetical protein VGK34_06860 [Armatimonadota bacterium]